MKTWPVITLLVWALVALGGEHHRKRRPLVVVASCSGVALWP